MKTNIKKKKDSSSQIYYEIKYKSGAKEIFYPESSSGSIDSVYFYSDNGKRHHKLEDLNFKIIKTRKKLISMEKVLIELESISSTLKDL